MSIARSCRRQYTTHSEAGLAASRARWRAGRLAGPSRCPLPASYWPYRGADGFGEPNLERIQRQLAVYLLRLRAANRKQADRLNIDLWPIPAAWCSVVLPTRTSADFDAQ